MLDFNSSQMRRAEVSEALNNAIDAALTARPNRSRDYLGASEIGKSCLRQIQYEYRQVPRDVPITGRTRRIFDRGHWAEDYMASLLREAGFELKTERRGGGQIGFVTAGGRFKGHCDGVPTGGPVFVAYPALWENKAVGAKAWREIDRKGVVLARPVYASQIALYQAYLDLTDNPALFTALNADTMEIHAELVPFDPARAQQMSDRAVQVIQATEAGETLPRVSDNPEHFECKWCAWRKTCWDGA